jgi:hypothetical protein
MRDWKNCMMRSSIQPIQTPPNIFRIIKSRKVTQAELLACIEMRNVYKILVGKPEGERPF